MGKRFSVSGWLVLLLGLSAARAQNLFVSQPYATYLNLNPAFAGIRADLHLALKYRNQWPQLPGTFVTNQLQADAKIPDLRGGAGLLLFYDQAGPSGLTRLEATASYAYHTPLTSRFSLSGGLGLGYGVQKVKFTELVFGDQLAENGSLISPTLENPANYQSVKYLNLQAGSVLYDNRFWLGVSAFHLNRPDQGFSRHRSLVPVKWVVTTGYKLFIDTYYERDRPFEWSVTPTLLYVQQNSLRRLDFGAYVNYYPLHSGLILRGVPLGGKYRYEQAVTALLGVTMKQLKVGYSFDIPTGLFGRSSGGAHELTLLFEELDYQKLFKRRIKDKKYHAIACPTF